MRLILAVDAGVAMVLFGFYIGTRVKIADWPMRTFWAGVGGVILYALAGQVKATSLGIPFDAYSWGGVAAFATTNLGLGWVLWQRLPQERR